MESKRFHVSIVIDTKELLAFIKFLFYSSWRKIKDRNYGMSYEIEYNRIMLKITLNKDTSLSEEIENNLY